jgi:hypothetical protein
VFSDAVQIDGHTLALRLATSAASSDYRHRPAAIEIEVAGMIVRVRGRVMADALVEVLTAVKRAR